MTARQSRTVLSLAFVALVLAVAAGLASLYHLGVAHADSGSAVALVDAGIAPDAPASTAPPSLTIDPAHPIASVQDAENLVSQQGWIWGGAAVLLAIGTFLAKKNDETHWIHNPYLLTGTVSLLALLGAVLNVHFGAATWGSVVPILLTAIGLVFKKPEPKAS